MNIELDKIYNESCLDTLAKMEDDSVDIVITSPPYNLQLRIMNGKYCRRRPHSKDAHTPKYGTADDGLPLEEYNHFHSTVLKECLRVADLIFYNIGIVTGSKRSVFKMIGDFSDNLKEIIVWDKGHAQPAMAEGVLNRQSELILVFENDCPISRQFRNRATFDRGTLSDVWSIGRERSKNKRHGAVMPTKLVETILTNFSRTGDIIFDPFMGTGTTALVAQQNGRHFIGSEIDPDFIETANERLRLQ